MSIRPVIASIILAIAVLGLALFLYTRQSGGQASEPALQSAFRFEIADTDAERMQGLSGRADVPHSYGLLFVFDHAERYGFWMKDMLVPIDMIWLADDGTILAIDEAVSPDTYPTPFYPPRPVTRVLETRAGEARAQGWGVGTLIPLPE